MGRHECKYWQTNPRHHYRWCGFCGRTQYDYTGEWKDELRSLRFLEDYIPLGGTSFDSYAEIEVGQPFEMYGYESWDIAFKIKCLSGPLAGKQYGPFPNFNCADATMRKDLEAAKKEAA